MVDLTVVDNDIVDLIEVDLLLQVRDKFIREGHPDGINKDRLLFFDKIGVIGRTLMSRVIVAMELQKLPIHLSHP